MCCTSMTVPVQIQQYGTRGTVPSRLGSLFLWSRLLRVFGAERVWGWWASLFFFSFLSFLLGISQLGWDKFGFPSPPRAGQLEPVKRSPIRSIPGLGRGACVCARS